MSAGAPIVLGAVAFGKPKPTTKDHPLSTDEAVDALLRAFAAHGGAELDTARVYQDGKCEEVLGRLQIARSLKIATKYHPNLPGGPIKQLDQSLAALGQSSVPILYVRSGLLVQQVPHVFMCCLHQTDPHASDRDSAGGDAGRDQ